MSETIKNKILIVEDEQDIRELYAEVLTDSGYVVETASDGEVGFDLIKSRSWDLLLLDVMLPGKDGMNILKDIKQSPELKKGPVLLLTNLNSEEIIRDAFSMGADGYLIKSEITPDKIIAEVNRYLGNE